MNEKPTWKVVYDMLEKYRLIKNDPNVSKEDKDQLYDEIELMMRELGE